MIHRIEELNHLLSVVSQLISANEEMDIRSVIEHCRSTVYRGFLPEHEKTVQYAARLGFLLNSETHIQLTESGEEFLSLNSEGTYDLSEDQARHLLRKHYLDGVFRSDCQQLFDAFSLSQDPGIYAWSELDGPPHNTETWLVSHLLQLGAITRTYHGLQTTTAVTELIASFLDQPVGMSEEKLRQLLDEKEAVGALAEALIMKFEQRRLLEEKCNVEATCIRHISKHRVNAGYDIESFNASSKSLVFDRFIEVKGSRGLPLRFFWSENELSVARKLGDKYWIYFQGGIDLASGEAKAPPTLFQNPVESILQNKSIEVSPHGLFIYGRNIKEQLN